MDNITKAKDDPRVLLSGVIGTLARFDIEAKITTSKPTEVDGQLFQSTNFEVKTKAGEWVVARTWTIAIDPKERVKAIDANLAEITKQVEADRAKLAKKESIKAEAEAEAVRVKDDLLPYLETEEAEPKEEVDTK